MAVELEDGVIDLESLFICEDYRVREFFFDEFTEKLLCSGQSSTDHNLTGQVKSIHLYLIFPFQIQVHNT